MGWGILLLAMVALPGGAGGGPQDPADRFARANRAYQAGDYAAAREHYEAILEEDLTSASLYYNLGNTYFKLGNIGRAVLNYERARRLAPRDDDVRANLELVNTLTVDEIPPLPEFWPVRVVRWWVTFIPRTGLRRITALAYLLAMTGVVGWILTRHPGAKTWALRMMVIGGTGTAIFGATLLARAMGWGEATGGVVLADEVSVRSAPLDDPGLELFTIHEGTRVSVEQRTEAWVEIRLADGQVGWMRGEGLEII